jgi:hypothetical protein
MVSSTSETLPTAVAVPVPCEGCNMKYRDARRLDSRSAVVRGLARVSAATSSHVRLTYQVFRGAALGLGLMNQDTSYSTCHSARRPAYGRSRPDLCRFFAITHEPVSPVGSLRYRRPASGCSTRRARSCSRRRPDVRMEHAPVAKGLLASTSRHRSIYAGAAFSRRGPGERDTRGMAVSREWRNRG